MALTEETKLLVRITAENATQRAFGEFSGQLDGLKNTVLKVAAIVGSALAFRDVIQSMRRTGDEIDRLRDELGLTAREASQLRYVAGAVSLSVDEMATSFGALNRKLIEQLPLVQEGKDDFTKWGIQVQGANGEILSLENILQNTRDRFRELPEGLARSGAAMDLFGRSGRQMLDFLMLGNDEVRALQKEAEDFGLVLDDAGVSSLEDFNRQVARMGMQIEGIKLQIGSFFIPIFRSALATIRENAGAFKVFGEAIRGPLGLIKEMADRFGAFIGAIKAKGFAAAFADLVTDFIEGAKKLLPKIGEELDKLGPFGWALKILLTLAAVELALGFAASLAGKVIGAAMSIPGVRLGSAAGIPAAAVAYTLSTGLLLSIIATEINNEASANPSVEAFVGVVKTILMAAGLILATAGAVAGLPIVLSVGAGVLIGLAAVEFGEAAEAAFRDLGPRLLQWLVNNLVPHLPFPLSLIGNALRVVVPLIVEWKVTNEAPPIGALPPGYQPAPPGSIPPGGLAGPPGGAAPPPPQPAPFSPPATLDDIYAAYTRNHGVMPDFSFAQAVLGMGPTWAEVQGLATGGVVTRPTRALIGEAGPEAVIPLDRWGGAGGGIHIGSIVVQGNVDSRERVDEITEAVAERLMTLASGSGPLRYR